MDELEVFYDAQNKKRALGVAYLAPSATTYNSGNPAYRIYTVDGNYPNSTWVRTELGTSTITTSRTMDEEGKIPNCLNILNVLLCCASVSLFLEVS